MTPEEKTEQDRREALREARVAAFFARQQGEFSRGEAAGRKVCQDQLRAKVKAKMRQMELI